MPFTIVRNDIALMQADAIVNTTGSHPRVGAGTDAAIHAKAGPGLLQARQAVGIIAPGSCALTPAFALDARYVIHTVGPVWSGGQRGEAQTLRRCYESALDTALHHGCRSIAFPLVSTGTYGFPKDLALQIAIAAFSAFLLQHEMDIFLVVFDRKAYRLSEQLFSSVASYIDQHYVDQQEQQRLTAAAERRRAARYLREMEENACHSLSLAEEDICYCAPAEKTTPSLEEMLRQLDAGFSRTLLQLIDKSGKKDAEVYKRANLTKQHFSKIRNNPDYRPTKPTAVALALALELDLAATQDLIGRAGYTLSNSSKFDLIIRYYIEQRNYNVVEINMTLYDFDQPLLGG